MSLYSQRGVSARKEEVHKATEKLSKGLYPYAFCKLYPDYFTGDDAWVSVMHADGAGTKSILAYLYWKETGDLSVWRGIAQDAIVMNLDDLLCVGIYNQILFSSTIDRNKKLIPGEVLQEIINGTQQFFDDMKGFGVNIHYLGGETADVGDVVRTIAVNGTMGARWPKNKLVTNDRIQAGDVIVGFASSGLATYEQSYNSGIASNGLTSARHDVLSKYYAAAFRETYEPSLPDEVVYIGKHRLTDKVSVPDFMAGAAGSDITVGKLLLSPTRTYAPLMKWILDNYFETVHGLVHCSGGGQTKCLNYLPGNFRVIKDNLFDPPVIFNLIREASGANAREMYQVFNMGHRMEIFTDEASAEMLIAAGRRFGIEGKIVGRVEAAERKEVVIKTGGEEILYS